MWAAAAASAVAAACASAAEAGTYVVHACTTSAGRFGNDAWVGVRALGIVPDTGCTPPEIVIGLSASNDGRAIADGSESRIELTAPPGASIAGFRLDGSLTYDNPLAASTHHRLYVTYRLDGNLFAGAGNYDNAVRADLNAHGTWYGYPENAVRVTHNGVTAASFPSLRGYAGNARTLAIAVGCFRRGSPCSLAASGRISPRFTGLEVTIADAIPPSVNAEASGLLAGGARGAAEPVRFSAGDNVGIQRVELLDVTTPAAPQVVAREDYAAQATDDGQRCSFTRPRPCPDLSRETIAAAMLAAGQRQLVLRVTDAAGNQTQAGPFAVDVAAPRDRGPLNGRNATERGTMTVRLPGGRRTRTVRYRSRVRIRGRVRNERRRGVGRAIVRVWRKDERAGARWRPVTRLRTDADGDFAWVTRATASRALRFDWPSHVNDERPAASGHARLRARAAARRG